MGQAIGAELVYAVGLALSPIAIVGVILMLSTPRGRANGPAFVGGWVAGVFIAGLIVLLLAGAGGADEGIGESDWVDGLKLALGVLLIVVGVRKRRGRSRGGGQMPSWMRSVDRFTAGRSAAMGAALGAVNPKNVVLIVAGATAIAETGEATGTQIGALFIFALLGSLGAGIPVILSLTQGDRAQARLDDLRDWMAKHNGAVIAVLCIVIGAKLVGEAISGFTV